MDKLKKRLTTSKKIIGLIILLVVIGWFGWRIFGTREKKPLIKTIKVKRGPIVSSVSASGSVIASNIMEITTQASGIVKKVYVKNGDRVTKGQKIVEITLDQTGQQKKAQAYATYLSAKNSLELAKATQYTLQAEMFSKWDTFKKLAESDSYKDENSPNRALPEFHIPQKEWLAAEAKYKNQGAVVAQTQANLNNAWLKYQLNSPIVKSPIEGTIAGLSISRGIIITNSSSSTTDTSSRIAVIKREGKPLARFNLSEIDISRVMTGQKTTITLDSFPDKTFIGKVISVDKIGAIKSGVTQYPTLIQLNKSVPEILTNMAVTATIIIERKNNVLLVPSNAVQTRKGHSFVRTLKKNKTKFIRVKTGLATDTETEIISGLNEDDLVVVNGAYSSSSQTKNGSPFGKNSLGSFRKFAR